MCSPLFCDPNRVWAVGRCAVDAPADGCSELLIGWELYRRNCTADGPFERVAHEANPFQNFTNEAQTPFTFEDVDLDGDQDLVRIPAGSATKIDYYQNMGGSFVRVEGTASPFHGITPAPAQPNAIFFGAVHFLDGAFRTLRLRRLARAYVRVHARVHVRVRGRCSAFIADVLPSLAPSGR